VGRVNRREHGTAWDPHNWPGPRDKCRHSEGTLRRRGRAFMATGPTESTSGSSWPIARRSRFHTRRHSPKTSTTARCCAPGWSSWPSRWPAACAATACAGRTVQLKVVLPTSARLRGSKTVSQPTNITDEIGRTAVELLENCGPSGGQKIRLVGRGGDRLRDDGTRRRPQGSAIAVCR